MACSEQSHLKTPLCIEEQILRLDIPMCHALGMEVADATQYLLKAALDFSWRHGASADGCIEVAACEEQGIKGDT